MKPNVIIYGVNLQAQQLKTYIEMENCACIHGFIIDYEYKTCDNLLGLPVYDFEDVTARFPPDIFEIVLSFGYKNMVRNRQEKFNICKRMGYRIYTYVSKSANVFTTDIGEGCVVYPGSTLAAFASLGAGNFLEVGTTIAHHSKIGDFNFFAPGSLLCGGVTVGSNCFLGSRCTIINNLAIADQTLVGAGAVITKSTSEGQVFLPARSTLWHSTSEHMDI